jgi:hypothetical protein
MSASGRARNGASRATALHTAMASVASRMVRRVLFRRHEQTHGETRMRLLRMLPRNSVGCEVGVWKGDFSAQILAVVKPRELHLIDPWVFADRPSYADAWYGGALARSQADMDRIYAGVLRRSEARSTKAASSSTVPRPLKQ